MKTLSLIILTYLINIPSHAFAECPSTIKVVYTPYYTKTFIDLYLSDFHNNIQQLTNCNVSVTTKKNDDDYLTKILNNDYMVTIIPKGLLTTVVQSGGKPLLKYFNKNGFSSIIIAKKEAGITAQITDLKNQLVLTPGKYSSSYSFLKEELSAAGIFDPSNINVNTPHEFILTKILDNQARYGATNTLAFNKLPDNFRSKFVIIKQSVPVTSFLITPNSTPDSLSQVIIESAKLIKAGPWIKP